MLNVKIYVMKKFNGWVIVMIRNYAFVWIEEENKWYNYIDERFFLKYDESKFLNYNGYVDYYVTVKDGIIIDSTYEKSDIGKTFADIYDLNSIRKELVGREFEAAIDFPIDIDEDTESYDIKNGETLIVEDVSNGEFKINNKSIDNWFIVNEEDLLKIIFG